MVTMQKGKAIQTPATPITAKAAKPKKAKAPVQIPPVLMLDGDGRKVVSALKLATTINVKVDAAKKSGTLTFIRVERIKAKKNDPWAVNESGTVERKMAIELPAIVRKLGQDVSTGTFTATLLLPDLFASEAFRVARPHRGLRLRVQMDALGVPGATQHALFLDAFNAKSGKLNSGFAGLAFQG